MSGGESNSGKAEDKTRKAEHACSASDTKEKQRVVQTVVVKPGRGGGAGGKATLAQIKAMQKAREEQRAKLAEVQAQQKKIEEERQRANEAARIEAEKKKKEEGEKKKVVEAMRRFRFGPKNTQQATSTVGTSGYKSLRTKSSIQAGQKAVGRDDEDKMTGGRNRDQNGRDCKEEAVLETTSHAGDVVGGPRMRSLILCVLGHVDTGKTKLLDALRSTDVQGNEAGGITQQIGATFFPSADLVRRFGYSERDSWHDTAIPGLLVIDTPGHESFTNLRLRGSSLCDLAILVVDIMHGLEPQTIESIRLLRSRRTPFVVALNKIDRIYDWMSKKDRSFSDLLASQRPHTQSEFDTRLRDVTAQFAAEGLNVAVWNENSAPKRVISLVPVSAASGECLGDLVGVSLQLAERFLRSSLETPADKNGLVKTECTVLEVKQSEGLGVTLDIILRQGALREGDKFGVCGEDGPLFSTVKALLVPQPLRELRVKVPYEAKREVRAVAGVRLVAQGLEGTLAGSRLILEKDYGNDEGAIRAELEEEASVSADYQLVEDGVVVCASTLGSLEALLVFLSKDGPPVAATALARLRKRDILRASLAKSTYHRAVLCFNVKVESDLIIYASHLGVKVFCAEIIYHLTRDYKAYCDASSAAAKSRNLAGAVFPVSLRIIPGCVFNSRSPLVLGVEVLRGSLRLGTTLCVRQDSLLSLGKVTSIEENKKPREKAERGSQVAIKIELPRGESPRAFGRHFGLEDRIYSLVTRESVRIVRSYFADELDEDSLQLLGELEEIFGML